MKTVKVVLLFVVCAGLAVSAFAGDGRIQRYQQRIPGEYILTFADTVPAANVPALARELARAHGGEVKTVWNHLVKGCALTISEEHALALSRDPRVASVEENAEWSLSYSYTNIDPETGYGQWYNRLWYLDRLDQPLYLDDTYTNYSTGAGVYIYIVDMGVWDGHQEFQTSWGTRVTAGFDATSDNNATHPCQGTGPFNFSHGTGVASIAAGKTVGLAPEATIVPVKVASCNGGGGIDSAAVVTGLDWIGTPYDYVTHTGNPDCFFNTRSGAPGFFHPAVVNMSFYVNPYVGSDATAITNALDLLNTAGAILVASANNQYVDACYTLPARHSRGSWSSPGKVITIGGTMMNTTAEVLGYPIPGAPAPIRQTPQDLFWTVDYNSTSDSSPHSLGCKPAFNASNFAQWTEGSNYGPCVSFLAPAKNIAVAFYDGTGITNKYRDTHMVFGAGPVLGAPACTGSDPRTNYSFASGTSFSAPMASGLIAQYLQHNPGATPDDVYWALYNNSIYGIVQNVPAGTPNLFLHQFQ